MADSQASETNGHSESDFAERSALQTPSLLRKFQRQLGFFAIPKMAERVWNGGDWSRERNRDPIFSGIEAGVALTIGENTWVPGRLGLPVDVTTVLGNLLDNAIYAARTGANEDKVVEVELLQDGSTLHITVADTGDGVAPEFVEHVFTEGKSTKPDSGIPGGRGIGMALSRQISRALGGDIRLSSPGNPDMELCGAEFIARLPGVMLEEEAQWVAQN